MESLMTWQKRILKPTKHTNLKTDFLWYEVWLGGGILECPIIIANIVGSAFTTPWTVYFYPYRHVSCPKVFLHIFIYQPIWWQIFVLFQSHMLSEPMHKLIFKHGRVGFDWSDNWIWLIIGLGWLLDWADYWFGLIIGLVTYWISQMTRSV